MSTTPIFKVYLADNNFVIGKFTNDYAAARAIYNAIVIGETDSSNICIDLEVPQEDGSILKRKYKAFGWLMLNYIEVRGHFEIMVNRLNELEKLTQSLKAEIEMLEVTKEDKPLVIDPSVTS